MSDFQSSVLITVPSGLVSTSVTFTTVIFSAGCE